MATVTSITAARAAQIEANGIVSGQLSGNDLILVKQSGAQVNVGRVIPAAVDNFPVGSLYFNATNSANPANLLGGGTWIRFAKGRMLVSLDETDASFDSVGKTGGAKTHTLTVAEMPYHNHSASSGDDSPDHAHGYGREAFGNFGQGGGGALVATGGVYYPSTAGATTRHQHAITVNANGGGAAHNNMSPYITVYIWQRTA